MRAATLMLAAAVTAGCAGSSAAETVWASCNQDVPGYAAVLDGDDIVIRTVADATRSQLRLDMEDAACTLGRAGAPDRVWQDVTASTVADPVQRASWEGWQAVWSVQTGPSLHLTVTGR